MTAQESLGARGWVSGGWGCSCTPPSAVVLTVVTQVDILQCFVYYGLRSALADTIRRESESSSCTVKCFVTPSVFYTNMTDVCYV